MLLLGTGCTRHKAAGSHKVGARASGVSLNVVHQILEKDDAELVSSEVLWAAAHTGRIPQTGMRWLQDMTQKRGALPQYLVPEVRQEILASADFRALLPMVPSRLGRVLRGLFFNDDTLERLLSEALKKRMSSLAPQVSPPLQELHLDLFLQPSPSPTPGFRMDELIDRWGIVLSSPFLWSRKNANSALSGLQFHELTRTLAEWHYLFGQEPGGGNNGGLSLDLGHTGFLLAPFDPRTQQPRYFSGEYSVYFENDSAIDMVRNDSTTWNWIASPIRLSEQTRLWSAAALGLARLRPARRSLLNQTAAQQATLPEDICRFPLGYLAGMEVLLNGPFVDSSTGRIFEVAHFAASPRFDNRPADHVSLTRLLRALALWSHELQNVDDLQLDALTRKRVITSRDRLAAHAQFVMELLLERHVGELSVKGSRVTHLMAAAEVPATRAESAEAIATLSATEAWAATPDPSLRKTVARLVSGFHKRYQGLEFSSDFILSRLPAHEAMWITEMLARCAGEATCAEKNPWTSKAVERWAGVLSAWDHRAR